MEKDIIGAQNFFTSKHPTAKAELRKQIAALEEFALKQPQLAIEITHHFSKSVYAREMFMPAGSIVIGKIHRHKNLNIISQGDVSFISVDGVMRVSAPFTFVASPGVKRVIRAHKDTIWTTIHGTGLTDLAEIEKEFIANDYSEIAEDEGDKCRG